MTIPSLLQRVQVYDVEFRHAATFYGLDRFLLASICERESECGLDLSPPGPAGTGDFIARHGKRYRRDNPRFKMVGTTTVLVDGKNTKAELYMPADGGGWGRGLMQIDFAFHPEFCDSGAWELPLENIMEGARILKEALDHFKGDEFLACCAYNCGVETVSTALLTAGNLPLDQRNHVVEHHTKDRNYGSNVLFRRDVLRLAAQKPH